MSTTAQKPAYTAAATFNELGLAYEQAFDNVPAQVRNINALIARLPAAGGARVLDLGCGTGKPAAALLAAAGHDVTGVDVAAEMVAIAARQVPAARFEVGDARTWAPADGGVGAFDAVVVCFSLIAEVSCAEIRGVFGRVAGLLRPGGLFLFATVAVEWDHTELVWMGRPVVASGLSVADNVAAIKGAGFEILHQEEEGYLPKAVEAGICDESQVFEEPQLYVLARKTG